MPQMLPEEPLLLLSKLLQLPLLRLRALRSPKPLDRISLEYLPCRLTTTSYRSLDRACCKSPRQLQVARHLQSELAQPLPEGRALLAALTAGAMATLAARTAWVTRKEATYSAILRQALLLADHLHRRSSPSITCPPKATGSDSQPTVSTWSPVQPKQRGGEPPKQTVSRVLATRLVSPSRVDGRIRRTQGAARVASKRPKQEEQSWEHRARSPAPSSLSKQKRVHCMSACPRRQPHWRSSAEGSSSSGAAQRNRCRRYMVKTCRLMLGNVESMRSTELRAAPRRFESAVAPPPPEVLFLRVLGSVGPVAGCATGVRFRSARERIY